MRAEENTAVDKVSTESVTDTNVTETNATETNATETNATETNATETNATETNATDNTTTETPPLLPHLQAAAAGSTGTIGNEGSGAASINPTGIDYEKEAQKLEDKALRFLAKQTHPVVIPSFASWFNISEIHDIEKKSIPDFFNESSRFKTEKAYRDTRNFMINTYRLSPYEYLTITAVRRNIAMDIASIVKIHSFLETWGLINYQIDPRSKSSLIGPSFTGHFQMILDTPQGLKPFIPQDKQIIKSEDGNAINDNSNTDSTTNNDKNIKFPVNLSLRKNIYDSSQDFNVLQSQFKNSKQIQKRYVCHTCGNDTVMIRYHNLRARDANICSRCFQEGHFGANFQASDFIRLENNKLKHSNWSDQEILLLLEAIEMYEDQWDKIVNHIGGNKNVEDCVEKFLTLPIEDKYIDDVLYNNKNSTNKKRKAETNIAKPEPIDTVKAIDLTIKSLLDGLHEKVLNESIPESAKQISLKYLNESQLLIQELVNIKIDTLDNKFTKLDLLETALETEKNKYVKETERLLSDRIALSKQINELNSELESLNVSKKLVLASEQVDSGLELVEKDKETDENEQTAAELEKKSKQELEALSIKEPQTYQAWSL